MKIFYTKEFMNLRPASWSVSPRSSLRSLFGDNPLLAESSFPCRFIRPASWSVFAVAEIKLLEALPKSIQRLFLLQEKILKENWRDPRLHLKKLKGRRIVYSLRITRSYRALFCFQTSDEIILFDIDHRKDIYR